MQVEAGDSAWKRLQRGFTRTCARLDLGHLFDYLIVTLLALALSNAVVFSIASLILVLCARSVAYSAAPQAGQPVELSGISFHAAESIASSLPDALRRAHCRCGLRDRSTNLGRIEPAGAYPSLCIQACEAFPLFRGGLATTCVNTAIRKSVLG